MPESRSQTLQEFFDSPLAMAARYNLSASAAEPMTQAELFGYEPGAAQRLLEVPLGYPARHGSEALIGAIANRYPGVGGDGVVLTSGLDDGLGMLFLGLVSPGDRVVVLTPCYPPHLQLPRWRGAEVVPWPARPENDWVPDLDALRALLETPTRLVIVTFPQNPTGFMPDRAYVDALIETVCGRGVTLVADEIYAGLPAGSAHGVTALASDHERIISLHGLSKTLGLPGLRVGWMASRDRAAIGAIRAVRNLFNAYLPGPIEFMADLALRHEDRIIARNEAIVGDNNRIATEFFARRGNHFEWRPAAAGVLSFPRWLGPGGTRALSDRLLARASLTFAPSQCFEAGDAHLRLSVARRSFGAALGVLDTFLDGSGG